MYKRSFISVWAGAIAGIYLWSLFYNNTAIQGLVGGSNLIRYAAICIVFLAVAFLADILFRSRVFTERLINLICVIACIGIVMIMYVCWERDVEVIYSISDTYLWHMYPAWLVFIILAAFTFLFKIVIEHIHFDGRKATAEYGLLICYVMILILGGYLNSFIDYLSADYYHGNAVFTSVYNVMHGVPYEEISNCIYGNYAIFLNLPMRIMGNGKYLDFSRIMSCLTMTCIALAIYAIHNLTEKKIVRVLCAATLIWPFIIRRDNYWQIYPIRILCPMLLIAWLVFLVKKADNIRWAHKYIPNMITYLILVYSIVWNKESGVVCLAGYLVFLFYKGMASFFASKDLKSMGRMLLECLLMMTSMLTAFSVVGLYNLCVSGKWITWKVFLFPLLTRSYMKDVLVMELETGIWPWMTVAFLFLGIIALTALKVFRKEDIDPEEYLYVTVAAIGLGLMSYFMNRPAWINLTICYYEAIICIVGVYRFVKSIDYGRIIAPFMRTLSLMVLIALVAGESLNLESTLYDQRKMDFMQNRILEFRDLVQEEVEEDTYAFGINVPELYSILGWDTRCYTTDWADLGITKDAILQKIYADLESEDTFITSRVTFTEANKDVADYLDELYYTDMIYEYNEEVVFYLMRRR